MLFNSVHFLLFLPIVFLLYLVFPKKFRWILLLVASCYFYMAFIPEYILILFAIIILDYSVALMLEKIVDKKKSKLFLSLSVLGNIGLLAVFKYFNFFSENVHTLAQMFGIHFQKPSFSLALPIGLSFHTFQSLSYIFEVYKGRFKAERHLGKYAVYVLYFPQMVAGPIERPQNVLPQLDFKAEFDYNRTVSAMRLMLLGFIKKILIADNLAICVNAYYANVGSAGTVGTWLAVLFFSIQIYCDFSGYSDIARGASRLFGIELMVNFKFPYLAKSVAEFWTRWHISLSSWFRDYLYIPLGGNRLGEVKRLRNVFIVFLLSGLWHGANWTFLIWGFIHGTFVIAEGLGAKALKAFSLPKVPEFLARGMTLFIVAIAWIFFRSPDFTTAFQVLHKLFEFKFLTTDYLLLGLSKPKAAAYIMMILVLIFSEHLWERGLTTTNKLNIARYPIYVRWAVYYLALGILFFLGRFTSEAFIYFQF